MIRRHTLYIESHSVNRYGIKHVLLSIEEPVYRKKKKFEITTLVPIFFYFVPLSNGRERGLILLL